MFFSECNLDKDLLRGIDEADYKVCTPVQEETFKHTFAGKDVSVQSQTGTGKTAAFLISLFNMMLTERDRGEKALIIAPTRELAAQIETEARLLGLYLPFSIGTFYGGVGYGKQESLLNQGVDIMIATPGRLLDFIQQGKIHLHSIGYLIIDEADRLFDMGFLPDLKRILRQMRPSSQRQTMLFSATLSYNVRRIASEYMAEPIEIEITPQKMTVDKIEQQLYHVSNAEKLTLLLGLLKKEKPTNCIIFVNMKSTAEELAIRLSYNGIEAQYLSGDLSQSKRERTVEQFKKGEFPLLIATDVAARGIHIDDLELIINFDLPEDSEVYIHRIGRTARAGKSGKAISLACELTVSALPGIEKLIGNKIPVVHAEEELYATDISKGKRISRSHNNQSGSTRNPRSSQNRSNPNSYQSRNRSHNRASDNYQEKRGKSNNQQDQNRRSAENSENTNRTGRAADQRSGQYQRRRRAEQTKRYDTSRTEINTNTTVTPEKKQKPKSIFKRIASFFKR